MNSVGMVGVVGVVNEVLADGREDGPPARWPAAGVTIRWVAGQVAKTDRLAAWIGRRTWPYPRVLWRVGMLNQSLFLEAADAHARLWAAEVAIRSSAVGAVVVDGSGFSMTATRRLQLLAKASKALVLVVRPAHERGRLSAAGMRWRVTPIVSPDDRPHWKVELLRCKGVWPMTLGQHGQSNAWTLRWEGASATVSYISPDSIAPAVSGGLPAGLAHGPPAPSPEPSLARQRRA